MEIAFIKACNQEELKDCLKVREQVFTVERGVSKEIEVDENDILDGGYEHFCVRLEGENVAAARCYIEENDTVKIQRFCVLKEYRERKVGRELLKYIENYYGGLGVKYAKLDSKYAVHGFYENCGYEKVSEIFIEADVEHIKMIKKLGLRNLE